MPEGTKSHKEPRYVMCEISSKPGLWACWDMEQHTYIYSDRRRDVMERYVEAHNEAWNLARAERAEDA